LTLSQVISIKQWFAKNINFVIHADSSSSDDELVIVIVGSVAGTAFVLILLGPLLALHIRKKLNHRAKIVDISQISKSVAAQETQSSLLETQFIVNNSDKAVYYINFSQNAMMNSENGNEETTDSF